MTMTAPPAKTAISDTYPNPTNAVARTGFGALWDYVTGLLGSTGFTSGMLSASCILDPQAIYNLSLVPSVAGNALTMTLKSNDGSTALAAGVPGTVGQRNATLATGTVLLRNITAAISTVISSGSTAGHLSGVLSPLYWYLIDNAGTQELAWSTTNFGVKGIASTTAEGGAGAADSATIMYSTTARTNVAFRRIGRTLDSQATAGTWTAVPTTVELEPLDVGPSNVTQVGQCLLRRKTADESVTSSTVLQDDDHLTFAIAANEEWVADFYITAGDSLNLTGVKGAITVPSGATLNVVGSTATNSLTSTGNGYQQRSTTSGADFIDGSAANFVLGGAAIHAHLWVLNGATPGNVTLQFAQKTSNGSPVDFKKGSYMVAHRIA